MDINNLVERFESLADIKLLEQFKKVTRELLVSMEPEFEIEDSKEAVCELVKRISPIGSNIEEEPVTTVPLSDENRSKIGEGYHQAGCGRGFINSPNIYLINERAYARHKEGWESMYHPSTSIENYVPVNYSTADKNFHALGVGEQHRIYCPSQGEIKTSKSFPDMLKETEIQIIWKLATSNSYFSSFFNQAQVERIIQNIRYDFPFGSDVCVTQEVFDSKVESYKQLLTHKNQIIKSADEHAFKLQKTFETFKKDFLTAALKAKHEDASFPLDGLLNSNFNWEQRVAGKVVAAVPLEEDELEYVLDSIVVHEEQKRRI